MSSLDTIRRLLLRFGYRLPLCLRHRFHRFLFDGARAEDGQRLKVNALDEQEPEVRFEFVGGCRDGQSFHGAIATFFYNQTDHGRIGARFKVASDVAVDAMVNGEPTGPILDHEYEVVENQVLDRIRYVRVQARTDQQC